MTDEEKTNKNNRREDIFVDTDPKTTYKWKEELKFQTDMPRERHKVVGHTGQL